MHARFSGEAPASLLGEAAWLLALSNGLPLACRYALDHIPKHQATAVYQRFVGFEKQHGDREGIEDVIVSERRFQYEAEVSRAPTNYDTWFDYTRLEESAGDFNRIREASSISRPYCNAALTCRITRSRAVIVMCIPQVYERAIAVVPPAAEKRYWQRYIYLWINYALWEELEAEDPDRTREVYRAALKLIPHSQFTFAKVGRLALDCCGARCSQGHMHGTLVQH